MRALRGLVGLAVLCSLSCGAPTGVEGGGHSQVSAVRLDPNAATAPVGTDIPLHVSVLDADGNVIAAPAVVWTVRDPDIASVSAAGVVTTRAVGATQVAASSGGRSAVASITVQQPPVASVAVQPSSPSLVVGQSTTLAASLADASGAALVNRAITWTSSDARIATVTGAGVVTAVAVGTATITAASEGKAGAATVTVVRAPVLSVAVEPAAASIVRGQSRPLTVTVTDANNVLVTDREVTWSSSDDQVAAVSPTGTVTARAVGAATITATSEGRSASARITVTPAPVSLVSVAPATSSLLVGRTAPLTATVTDAGGAVVSDRLVTWTTSDARIATVSAAGVVTAIAPGTVTITAESETKTGTATVTVTAVPVASVSVDPPTLTLNPGGSATLTAIAKDADGNIVTGRAVGWTSSNPLVATVSGAGVVSAVSTGSATISAVVEGKSASAAVLVARAPVGSVSVAPSAPSLLPGGSTTLVATVRDVNGVIVTDRGVTWTSDNTVVATVSSSGMVTALAPGVATITAASETKTGTSRVTVTTVPVATVSVEPPTATVWIGHTTPFTATAKDAQQNVLTGRVVTWASSNQLVATVDAATGVVTGRAVGSATISASVEGKSASASVTVTRVPVASVTLPASASLVAGQTTTLVATVRDADGAVVTDRVVSWSSSATSVATVSAAGVVTAVSPGSATITATSEGKSGATLVTVTPVPVGSVIVAPASKSLVVGASTTLVATVKDANGTTVTDRVVTWTTSNSAVATVSPTGVVTAAGAGTATITATSEGKSGSSAITVTLPPPAPVASVTVDPPTLALTVGKTATLTAITKDASGNVLTGRVVTWISNNPTAVSVSPTGVVTALAVGSAIVTASSEGWNGSATVTVTRAPVQSVTLPAAITLPAGGQTTLTAVVMDDNGTVVTDRLVTWISSNPAVATVSATGVVKALITGTATITATSEGKSGSTTLTVTPAPVGSVSLSPFAVSIASGSTVTLVPTVKDTTGTVVTDRVITWTSSNEAVATVSSSGVVTGRLVGNATITATSEGKSGSSTITVTPGPAATVTVLPPTATVKDGSTVQLTATAVDASGNAITGRSFAWATSDQSVATVNGSGKVTGRKAGTVTITATLDGKNDSSVVTVTP